MTSFVESCTRTVTGSAAALELYEGPSECALESSQELPRVPVGEAHITYCLLQRPALGDRTE